MGLQRLNRWVGKVPPNSWRARRKFSRSGWLALGLQTFHEASRYILVITNDNIFRKLATRESTFYSSEGAGRSYSRCRDNEEGFLGVPCFTRSEEPDSGNRKREARSISQVCELLPSEGVQAYKKERPKFIHRLAAKQKARSKD